MHHMYSSFIGYSLSSKYRLHCCVAFTKITNNNGSSLVCLPFFIIIRPHRSNSQMRPIAADGVAWSVCVSVC